MDQASNVAFADDREILTLSVLGALVSERLAPPDVDPAQWPEIIPAALRHGLGPMLWWVLKQHHVEEAPQWEPLVWAYRSAMAQQIRFEYAQAQVQTALAEANIPAMWIKGSALAHTIYPKPSLRPMCDLDVLVPYDRREAAFEVVTQLGYHFPASGAYLLAMDDAITQKLTHHYHLRGGPGDGISLELHFRLLGRDTTLLPPEQMAWMWDQTEPFTDGSHRYLTLRPEAHLLYLSAHAILQHGESISVLRHYFDLHRLVGQSSIDWNLVLQQAVTLKWTYAVERALSLAVRFFETPVPQMVLEQLGDRRPMDENVARAIHLQDQGTRWEHMQLALGPLSVTDKARLTVQVIFPRPAYMRQRYRLQASQAVWPSYLYRWTDQAKAIGWWMRQEVALRWGRHRRSRTRGES